MADSTYRELEQALEREQLVLWLGADLPEALTRLPARSTIAATVARQHGLPAGDSLAEVAALIQQGPYRRDLITIVLDAYGAPRPDAFPRALLWLIREHNLRNIVSTAVDRSLEVACDSEGIPYASIVDDTDLAFAEPQQLRIFRLYGHVQRKDRLVISEDDHLHLLADPLRGQMLAAIRQLFAQYTALFLGYNPQHLDYQFLLAGRGGESLARRAYVVWPACDEASRRKWARRQVIILDRDPFGIAEPPQEAAVIIDTDRPAPPAPPIDEVRKVGRGDSGEKDLADEELKQADEALTMSTLRIDAAAPQEVVVNQAFTLAVAIRQPASPPLQEDDLDNVHSGEAQIFVHPEQPFVTLRLQISAPGCLLDGPNTRQFRLPLGHDSPVFYFNLTPQQAGTLNIIIQLYQEDNWLGSTRVRTKATTQAAGRVQVQVTSSEAAAEADRVASKRRQLEDAQLLLAIIEEQLAAFPVGAQPPHLLLQKRKQQDAIRELEMELGSLQAGNSGDAGDQP